MSGPEQDPAPLRDRLPGIFEVTTQSGALPQVLSQWGWRVGVLRVEGIEDRRSLLQAIGRALDFGEWFGANLDALADSLSDVDRPTALVLDEWPRATEVPGWPAVWEVLVERTQAADEPAFALVMDRSG